MTLLNQWFKSLRAGRRMAAVALVALSQVAIARESVAATFAPLPAFSHTYSDSTRTRGFWFTAPTSFTITGLRVPNEAGELVQNVQVVRMNGNLPPAHYEGNDLFVSLLRVTAAPAATVIACEIPVAAGEVIGILGAAGTTLMRNSYAAAGGFSSSIAGNAVTIERFGTQVNIWEQPAIEVWTELGGNLSRVEMYYTVCDNDGIVDTYEECDDGDADDGDGCSSACVVEAPCWSCAPGSPSVCSPLTAGSACGDDADPCTGSGVCDGAGTCDYPGLPDGASCDDGLYCNGTDTCTAGACGHTGDPCSGGAECNDTCNEGGDNCFTPFGVDCTADDNVCTYDICDGSGVCSHDYNNDGAPCDDGLFCTGADYCLNGSCEFNFGDPCGGPDGDGDCQESCDEDADSCSGDDPDGSPCTDISLCTVNQCSGGSCGIPVDCDDGDICTADSCDSLDGSCVNDGVPAVSCRAAGSSNLTLKQSETDSRDQLAWKWSKGEATTVAELEDPNATAAYTLCVYDDGGSVSRAAIPAAATCAEGLPCWKSTRHGFKFKDRSAAHDGVTGITFSEGAAGKAKAALKGKGELLDDPILPLNGTVTVQLHNEQTGLCLGATYAGDQISRNEPEQFKAKAKTP